jgi:hypothetical protein
MQSLDFEEAKEVVDGDVESLGRVNDSVHGMTYATGFPNCRKLADLWDKPYYR